MKKAIPISIDNFKEIIEEEYYYADKTKVIEDLVLNKSKLVLFSRPRRFGKSLFISMLEHFFDVARKGENKNLFAGLYISKSPVCEENLNKYPVISVDFKNLKYDNYEKFEKKFKSLIADVYIKNDYVLDSLKEADKIYFNSIMYKHASIEDYEEAFLKLSEWLEKYHGEKVVILVDEYDVPIESGRIYDYHDRALSFIKTLFSNTFKGNDSLRLAVLTGVLRVSGENLFSSFNNVKIYDIMSLGYNEYFGFTEKETEELLKYYDLELTHDVKEYYDGYNFNGVDVYNPWSILNYANDKVLMPYWVNSGGNLLIKEILSNLDYEEIVQIENLVVGQSIRFEYNPKLSYNTLMNGLGFEASLNLMLVSGYLTLDYKDELGNTYFRVPNKEVRKDFAEILEYLLTKDKDSVKRYVKRFIDGLEKNDKRLVEENLNIITKSISYHDNKEAFYHGWVMGLISSFINDNNVVIQSNLESGYGRADLIIKRKNKSLGIVLEFKVAKKAKEMEEVAREALCQMEELNYKGILENDDVKNIYEYAIVFHGKKAIVR